MPNQYIDYVNEGKIRQACADAGVLEDQIDTFIVEYRANKFSMDELDAHIANARVERPHRWVGGADANEQLYVDAFGPTPSLTKQGQVVKLVGETQAREIALRFAPALGASRVTQLPRRG
jgi:hypothetical protein